ncbi:hypothetical protein CROQUDRAFT_88686 [Cronartium quercuum f. sp. fusiforme G11]|uniref:Uncharacterized protein n=1 Tax=Cronartium quercuum f. sp. fusiforme G11 TaxID=708437 RepID=A0A9P6NPV0_9BASI|nr:hypothetical protein CROQUDRAFT_88686 [Cronartium quercuum f. sp. fusiforme G11]
MVPSATEPTRTGLVTASKNYSDKACARTTTDRDEKISVNHGPRSTWTSLSENILDSLVQVIFAGGG